jgi:signal transduction histidine kinase
VESIITALNSAKNLSNTAGLHTETIVSFKDMIYQIVEANRSQLELRKQTVEVEVSNDLRPVEINTKLMAEVLQELLYNAISYSPNSSIIQIRVTSQGNNAQIEVIDHGIGIPAQDQGRIFSKFARGSNAAAQKPVGNGLGLYLAKGIIEKAGGSIAIRSSEGHGTTVTITLPFMKGNLPPPTVPGLLSAQPALP